MTEQGGGGGVETVILEPPRRLPRGAASGSNDLSCDFPVPPRRSGSGRLPRPCARPCVGTRTSRCWGRARSPPSPPPAAPWHIPSWPRAGSARPPTRANGARAGPMASEWGSGPGKAGLPRESEGTDRTPMGHEPKAVTSCGQSVHSVCPPESLLSPLGQDLAIAGLWQIKSW